MGAVPSIHLVFIVSQLSSLPSPKDYTGTVRLLMPLIVSHEINEIMRWVASNRYCWKILADERYALATWMCDDTSAEETGPSDMEPTIDEYH